MNSDRKLFANGSVSNCGQSGRLSIIYGNRPAVAPAHPDPLLAVLPRSKATQLCFNLVFCCVVVA